MPSPSSPARSAPESGRAPAADPPDRGASPVDEEILTGPAGGIEYEGDPIAPDEAVAADQLAAIREHPDGGEPLKGRRLIFAIVSIALFMASIDATIVATAFHSIERGLHANINWASWTVTIYALGQIIAMPLAGKLSDQFGRKRIFVGAIVLFTVSSLLCGLSTSIYMLIPLRLIQAIGGGAFMPSASGIVADHFGRDRDRALGMFTSIFPIGGIVGPTIGGPISAYLGWRWIFFINVPIGAVLLVLAIRFLPVSVRRPGARVDVRGVCMLATTIVLAMTTISVLGEAGMSPFGWQFLVPLAATVGFGWAFARHTRHAEAPFIPLRLIAGKGFATMNVINLLFGIAVLGFGTLVPLYAQDRYGISQATAGTVLSARAVGVVVVAAVAALMLRRTGYRLPMFVGFSTIVVGIVMLSIGARGLPPYWWLAIFCLVTGVGMGTAVPATNNASLQLAPNDIGAISGLRGMFRQSGGILYVSITTAVLARSPHDRRGSPRRTSSGSIAGVPAVRRDRDDPPRARSPRFVVIKSPVRVPGDA